MKTFDAITFAALSSNAFTNVFSATPWQIVFGCNGQAAIRCSEKVILFDSPILR